ncbi:hypothetical protein JCM6882_002170 [Rhodosporidiobolus microsporus]
MEPARYATRASTRIKNRLHASAATPTANDNGTGREEDVPERDVERRDQDAATKPTQADPDDPAPLSPSFLRLPTELHSTILHNPSLSTGDRAACCRISRAFLPVARQALHQIITVELFNYQAEDSYVVIDRSQRAVLNHLARVPSSAAQVKELIVIVHEAGDSWPPIESSDPDAVDSEPSDAGRDFGSYEYEPDPLDEAFRGLRRDDFDLRYHLEAVLRATSNLSRLEPPALPSSSRLRHLTITGTHYSHLHSLVPILAAFSGLRFLALGYDPIDATNNSFEEAARPDLRPLTRAELETFSLTISATWSASILAAESLRFPPNVTTLELRARSGYSDRWTYPISNRTPLLAQPFLANLPSRVSHLRIDLRPFDSDALADFFASPVNLPHLKSVTVLKVTPDRAVKAEEVAEAIQEAEGGVAWACKQRGVRVGIEQVAGEPKKWFLR